MATFSTKIENFGLFEKALGPMMRQEIMAAQKRAAATLKDRLAKRVNTIKPAPDGNTPMLTGAVATGTMQKSFVIRHDVANLKVQVLNNATDSRGKAYFKAVESDTVPHNIPIPALLQWVEDRFPGTSTKDMWTIAWSIHRRVKEKGTVSRNILSTQWLNGVAVPIYKAELNKALMDAAQEVISEAIRTRGVGFLRRVGVQGTAALRAILRSSGRDG